MREIKFRAKKDDHSDYRWVYGELIYDLGIPRIKELSLEMLFTTCIQGTEGQYTGLTDKNGKEIYEGDLLNKKTTFENNMADRRFQSETEIKVIFKDGMFMDDYSGYPLYERMMKVSSYKKESWTNYEITGNIHDK